MISSGENLGRDFTIDELVDASPRRLLLYPVVQAALIFRLQKIIMRRGRIIDRFVIFIS
jgi:hypothetical protein